MNFILQIILLVTSINTSIIRESNSDENKKELASAKTSLELINNNIEQRFATIGLEETGLSKELFRKGLVGYLNLKSEGEIKKDIITLIDFKKSSNEKRMWIIDLAQNVMLKNTLVAHGKNSGGLNANDFSNIPNSFRSSLGCYITTDTYIGKHGLSLRLDGIDKMYNSNAASRYIVLHGASYVSDEFIKRNGRLGRSHGCPAVPINESNEIIELIKGSSFLYIDGISDTYSSKHLEEEILFRKHEYLPPLI